MAPVGAPVAPETPARQGGGVGKLSLPAQEVVAVDVPVIVGSPSSWWHRWPWESPCQIR